MYIVSACLAGINCRYNGGNSKNEVVSRLVAEGQGIPVCPEVLGGLPIPRPCSEMMSDKSGSRKIISKDGQDLTKEFQEGAEKTLKIAEIIGAEIAILQSRSPSCGYGKIYDGSFSGKLIKGNGITAELLSKNGVTIYSEKDVDKLNENLMFDFSEWGFSKE